MNIKIKNFEITADDRQFILKEWVEPKNKEKDSYLSTIGFYPTFEGLVKKLLHLRLGRSDTTALKEILEEIDIFKKEMSSLLDIEIK